MASLEDDFVYEASNDVQNLVYSDTELFIDSDDEADDDHPTGLSSANSTARMSESPQMWIDTSSEPPKLPILHPSPSLTVELLLLIII